eukprot:TRINITY_DN57672_c0_g1_i1.p1 TRINITY_DN57672_c0_g1~~TRINITY_DN57672_c0_g1_i1.p1  ORF type:complete len:281 (-),score=61.43 TRINITY_DN57672_c0_g1_i1:105-947(-)
MVVKVAPHSDAAMLPCGESLVVIATCDQHLFSGQVAVDLGSSWSYGTCVMSRQDDHPDSDKLVLDYETSRLRGQWSLVFKLQEHLQTETATDIIFQHERRASPFNSYTGSSLETWDPPNFSDLAGQRIDPRNFELPSRNWEWDTSGWSPQLVQGSDHHGWKYASDFDQINYEAESGFFTYVRKRALSRPRTRQLPQNLTSQYHPERSPGIVFSKSTMFSASAPTLFSECNENVPHWLEIGCVDPENADTIGSLTRIMISDGDIQKKPCCLLYTSPSPRDS